MGDHYCCKNCGQQYDKCECKPARTPSKKQPRKKVKKEKPLISTVNTEVRQLDDFSMPICDLQLILADLAQKYGPGARIYCDAGHNNVSVYVEHLPCVYGTLVSLPDSAVTGEVCLTIGNRYALREDWPDGSVTIDTDDPGVVTRVHRARLNNIGKGEDA